jgi:predicted amidohydrolase YtcJ
MNTHAIGDSANFWVLKVYEEALKEVNAKDRRWRNEHSQIVDGNDFSLFNNVFPSVQPTHATSDMYWAEDRVGMFRIKGGYAYKQLLDTYGMVALGTDYPVEKVNPFLTFYAAVERKDTSGYPKGGYQMENALTREETLKGMTIWAAYSNFEENEKGSIEVGKFADFAILDQNIMEVEGSKIPNTQAVMTFLNGEKVFERK